MGKTSNYQWNIRQAIQRLHKAYFKTPWTFMTEADVQCALYSELSGWFYANKSASVSDVTDKRVKDWNFRNCLALPIVS